MLFLKFLCSMSEDRAIAASASQERVKEQTSTAMLRCAWCLNSSASLHCLPPFVIEVSMDAHVQIELLLYD